MLEVVISLNRGNSTDMGVTAEQRSTPNPATNSTDARDGCAERVAPTVRISSTGEKITVEDSHEDRQFDLILPQRVVRASAKSFFWDGSLTVRAVLVEG